MDRARHTLTVKEALVVGEPVHIFQGEGVDILVEESSSNSVVSSLPE